MPAVSPTRLTRWKVGGASGTGAWTGTLPAPIETPSMPEVSAFGNSRAGGFAAEELCALGDATGDVLQDLLRLLGDSSEGEPPSDGDPGITTTKKLLRCGCLYPSVH